jgi:quercetin dioxygenase-like cupin family protein
MQSSSASRPPLALNYDVFMPRRREFLLAAGLPAFASFAATAGSKLPDTVLDPSKAKLSKEKFGDLRVYFDGPTDQLRAMTAGSLSLNPGMSPHPPHQHAEEEIMVISEGTGEITVDGKPYKIGPGSMMYCAANKLHGVTNTGTGQLLFYYYKWRA